MNIPELLKMDGVETISLTPAHHLTKEAVEKGCLGVVWTSKCDLLGRLHAQGVKTVVNTTRSDLEKGDYGAVIVDGGYLVVCNFSCYSTIV